MLVFGVCWLALAWGLVALTVLFRRKTVRLVILALLVPPAPPLHIVTTPRYI
jgi:hypothetical protein